MMPSLNLDTLLAGPLDGTTKGFPAKHRPLHLADIATMQWNVLRHDLPFPVAVLKDKALTHNSQSMRSFLEATGALLCPHGKSTMSPQLFERQLHDGAWGLTAATTTHVKVYRRAGAQRIFFANQLIGKENITYIAEELRQDPAFEFYCLIDSVVHLKQLAATLKQNAVRRPVNVLVEMGVPGGRCGVRSVGQGIELARQITAQGGLFNLVGIEAFEGVFSGDRTHTSANIDRLLRQVVELAELCDRERLFSGTELLLTAGGSTYFNRVIDIFKGAQLSRNPSIVIRSGCYLTHDHRFYAQGADFEKQRCEQAYPDFVPALEVWACVQSMPEPGLAILALGKRDISHDIDLPIPCYHAANGNLNAIELGEFEIVALSDHHAFMRHSATRDLAIGDLIGLGVSHPCTTFDKWQLLYLVDDHYNLLAGIRTFF